MSTNTSAETTTATTTTDHTYPYYKNVQSPQNIGMSEKGTLSAFGKDIKGLMSYVEILVSGKGRASKTGMPLGNKFFVTTKATCKDARTGSTVPRSFYVNNVPMGNIPIISSGMGEDFTEFRGLLPGVISGLDAFDPAALFDSFTEGSNPPCQSITMETIDSQNNKSYETNYVRIADIERMDPCTFSDGTNPVTHNKCGSNIYKENGSPPPGHGANPRPKNGKNNRRKSRTPSAQPSSEVEGFRGLFAGDGARVVPAIPADPAAQAFFASVGILLIYVSFRAYSRNSSG